jgi:hypothetical protein
MGQKVVYTQLDPEFIESIDADEFELTADELAELSSWEQRSEVTAQ